MNFVRRHKFAAVCAAGLGCWVYDTYFQHERFNRSVRTVAASVNTIYQYKFVLEKHPEKLFEVHENVAQTWFDLCSRNGGLYIKLGQGIATMNHVLPPAYLRLFSNLWDKAPSIPFDEVRKVVQEDFGKPLEEIFSHFEKEPIASASIAQVHQARLHDGTTVAVKVQKPAIQVQMEWDLFLYRTLVWLFDYAFELPMYWTVDHTCEHLRKEANFYVEALNTVQAKLDLEKYLPRIYVPTVDSSVLSRRIMVQEWITGIKASEPEALEKAGFSVADVMHDMIEAFSHQIFVSGFVHVDPHPGNVLVRKVPGKQHEVVILDHGLCVRESERFRLEYCRLWRAMLLLDVDTVADVCRGWGVNDYELFASIQLFRPFRKNSKALHLEKPTAKEMYEMQIKAKDRLRQMLQTTAAIPQELLLIGRCLNILRSNNKRMGSIVNRISVMAEKAAEGIRFNPSNMALVGAHGGLRSFYDRVSFRVHLWILSALYTFTEAWRAIQLYFTRTDRGGLEDVMDQNIAQVIHEKFGMPVDPNIG